MPTLVKAPPVPRLVAFGIDYFLFGILGGVLFWGMLGLGLRARPVAWVVAVLSAALLEWRLGGASLGKRLMQMRTSDRYGLPPGFALILARTSLKALGPGLVSFEIHLLPAALVPPIATLTMLLWVASFLPALGKSRLAMHDRITRTRVIFAESPSPRPDRGA